MRLRALGRRSGEQPAVLIVDDRRENLVALEAILRPLNLTVHRAMTGEEAMKLALKHDLALILLDVQMPGLDGFEVARYMKQLDKTRHIPIIFLTAINKEDKHVFTGYTAGAVDYIFKPFEPEVLRSKVRVFVDLYETASALRESEERFHKAFEHAPMGMALAERHGGLVDVNRALSKLVGHPPMRLTTMTFNDLLHPEDVALDLDGLVAELAETGQAVEEERRLVTSNGTIVHALLNISVVGSSSPYFIFQIHDFTERQRANDFRKRFIAHAAHELRTPASVILGTASLLKDSLETMSREDLAHAIGGLNRQSQRMTRMINNMLDLARLEEGQFSLQPAELDLRPVLEAILRDLPTEGRVVEVDVPDDMRAVADRASLEQIVTNLVVNATRYGGGTIRLRAADRNGVVKLVVEDDGDGVPEYLRDRLFDPFVRGKRSSSVGGSGLGLTLVRNLAEANGGTIDYESGEPKGARFVLTLRTP